MQQISNYQGDQLRPPQQLQNPQLGGQVKNPSVDSDKNVQYEVLDEHGRPLQVQGDIHTLMRMAGSVKEVMQPDGTIVKEYILDDPRVLSQLHTASALNKYETRFPSDDAMVHDTTALPNPDGIHMGAHMPVHAINRTQERLAQLNRDDGTLTPGGYHRENQVDHPSSATQAPPPPPPRAPLKFGVSGNAQIFDSHTARSQSAADKGPGPDGLPTRFQYGNSNYNDSDDKQRVVKQMSSPETDNLWVSRGSRSAAASPATIFGTSVTELSPGHLYEIITSTGTVMQLTIVSSANPRGPYPVDFVEVSNAIEQRIPAFVSAFYKRSSSPNSHRDFREPFPLPYHQAILTAGNPSAYPSSPIGFLVGRQSPHSESFLDVQHDFRSDGFAATDYELVGNNRMDQYPGNQQLNRMRKTASNGSGLNNAAGDLAGDKLNTNGVRKERAMSGNDPAYFPNLNAPTGMFQHKKPSGMFRDPDEASKASETAHKENNVKRTSPQRGSSRQNRLAANPVVASKPRDDLTAARCRSNAPAVNRSPLVAPPLLDLSSIDPNLGTYEIDENGRIVGDIPPVLSEEQLEFIHKQLALNGIPVDLSNIKRAPTSQTSSPYSKDKTKRAAEASSQPAYGSPRSNRAVNESPGQHGHRYRQVFVDQSSRVRENESNAGHRLQSCINSDNEKRFARYEEKKPSPFGNSPPNQPSQYRGQHKTNGSAATR